jgi:fumarate hydratase class II
MMHIAVLQDVVGHLRPALAMLRDGFAAKARAFSGQGFDTFARQIGATSERLDAAIPRLGVVPQGGTPGRTMSRCPANSKRWRRTTNWCRSPAS